MPEQEVVSAPIDDPMFYIHDPHTDLASLRNSTPVLWHERGQFWAVLKHRDVVYVSRHPELFSSRLGVNPDEHEHPGRIASRMVEGSEFMLMTDPPRHGQLRRMISEAFSPRAIRRIEPNIRSLVRDIVAALPAGEVFDFYETVAAELPIQVVCSFMGLPASDARWLKEISVKRTEAYAGEEASAAAGAAFHELEEYFTEILMAREREPSGDLLSMIAVARDGEHGLDLKTAIMFCIDVLVAGNETTDPSLSGGMMCLAQHPDQLRKLITRPELMENAAEEILRWVSPVVAMCRTAVSDVELRGQRLRAGDYLWLMYISANRDEDVFTDPGNFDVEREDAYKQLAFGSGAHACIGAALARLELRIYFEEFCRRFSGIEIAGDIEYRANIQIPRIVSMPIRAML